MPELTVPSEVIEVLRWHGDTQLTTSEQKTSELSSPPRTEEQRFEGGVGLYTQLVGPDGSKSVPTGTNGAKRGEGSGE
jgi:hypothetical protein